MPDRNAKLHCEARSHIEAIRLAAPGRPNFRFFLPGAKMPIYPNLLILERSSPASASSFGCPLPAFDVARPAAEIAARRVVGAIADTEQPGSGRVCGCRDDATPPSLGMGQPISSTTAKEM